MNPAPSLQRNAAEAAAFVRERLPSGGLFEGHEWRISPEPFLLAPSVVKDLEFLGRILLKFYQVVDLLYRQSLSSEQPSWAASYLDRGKPEKLLQWQRALAFKNQIPRVIRPDILLTEEGMVISELDGVPGGIGLTGWLNQTYSALATGQSQIIGGSTSMPEGFASIFGQAPRVHIAVSDEAGVYRPEMQWLAEEMNREEPDRFVVHSGDLPAIKEGEALYRFFELFDLGNVAAAETWFNQAAQGLITVTPPPKPLFEEKLLFALFWNRHLEGFWHRALGESFLRRLRQIIPYSWTLDPAPLPPHGAVPELNLTSWHQLKTLSQRQRDLILKVSGYSEEAWGARGVYLGSDLSVAEWSEVIDKALNSFERSPYVLQRYHKPGLVQASWFDFDRNELVPMQGRVRLCPYYFVSGEGGQARAQLSGILATICPAEKKIIHGMKEAILAPCASAEQGWAPRPSPARAT